MRIPPTDCIPTAMPDTFHIKLTGKALAGFSLESAARGLASVMRIDEPQAVKLLSAGETIVKRSVRSDQVQRYLDAMARVGVEACAEPMEKLWEEPGFPCPDAPAPAVNAAIAAAPRAPDQAIEATPATRPVVPFPRPIGGRAAAGVDSSRVEPPPGAAAPWAFSAPELLAERTLGGDAAPGAAALGLSGTAAFADPSPALQRTPAPEVAVALGLVDDTVPSIETMACPACGARQPKRTLCRECGADMPRLLASRRDVPAKSAGDSVYAPPKAVVRDFVAEVGETPRCFGFSLRGRIGRLRYLAYGLPAYLVVSIAVFIQGALAGKAGSPSAGAAAVAVIIGVVFGVFLSFRLLVLRLHDMNRSAWWLLLAPAVGVAVPFAPSLIAALVVGASFMVVSLLLVFWPGSRQGNDYGPPPGANSLWTVLGAVAMIGVSIAGTAMAPPGKLGSGGFEGTFGGERQRR